jgi:Uma2 family endonuclease
MTMTATISAPRALERGGQVIEMRGIGWEGYSTILRVRGERGVPRMLYLDGDLLLMSPLYPHERLKTRLGRFVSVVVEELDIPCTPAGSTTFRLQEKGGGVEGDESYYFENEPLIRGKGTIDLRVDPPPDLAIEVVFTHDADEALEVYRRLGVPEVWVRDEDELIIRVLGSDGQYSVSSSSRSLPFLTAAEVFDWVGRPQTESETRWLKDLRRWVAETLPARRREQP